MWLVCSVILVFWEDREKRMMDEPQFCPTLCTWEAFLSLRSEQGHQQSSPGQERASEPHLTSIPTPRLTYATWDRHLPCLSHITPILQMRIPTPQLCCTPSVVWKEMSPSVPHM